MESEDQFIEDMGLYFEAQGVPRMAGRMLAWLLICDPPEQTMPEIVARLKVSKGSVSTMTRILTQFGLIERVSRPGIRADFYRIVPHFGEKILVAAIQKFGGMRAITARGLALLQGAPPERTERLQELHDVYAFLEEGFPAVIAEWRERREAMRETTRA
jgi:DNA-binding MarR family transcriptional regulator